MAIIVMIIITMLVIHFDFDLILAELPGFACEQFETEI